MIKKTQTSIVNFLILGALEFFSAAAFIFSPEPDPKNAIFLGFSAARWTVASFTIVCGLFLLYFARRTHRGEIPHVIENFVTSHFLFLQRTAMALFLLGLIVLLSPPSHLGHYGGYYERVRPLLVVTAIVPLQFFAGTLFKRDVRHEIPVFKGALVVFTVFIALAAFIVLTRLGIHADTHFWNVAGVPLTTVQLLIILLVTYVSLQGINKLSVSSKLSPILIDVGIALLIYIVGVWIWSQTPMLKHFNALRPAPPAFQYFPYSDSRVHDMGALSILSGYGIYFGEYTDKPLYMVMLSMLHRLAGSDYNNLSLLHLYGTGLILPCLFWLGRLLHSRHLGIALALLILIRQRNAILLAHLLAGTNPRLLLTEIPTMLGLIVLCIFVFLWLKEHRDVSNAWSYAFLAGGALGASSLIRLNPFGLFPIVLLGMAIALRKMGTSWFQQTLIFALGFLVVFTPWVLTGRDANGSPYLWVKFVDVINVRYFPDMPSLEQDSQTKAIAPKKLVALPQIHPPNDSRTPMDPEGFPGFVINHSLHNVVAAFLTLPDSVAQKDQVTHGLLERPYFDEKQTDLWQGELQVGQVPFLVINLFLIALGLRRCWDRWKWAGIFPILIFAGYILTLGFARNSGSRYIVPIDWVVFLYYTVGIITLLEVFTIAFESFQKDAPFTSEARNWPRPALFAVSFVLLLSLLVPLAQRPILLQKYPACESLVNHTSRQQFSMLKGKVLYPYASQGSLSFTFLTCDQTVEIFVQSPNLGFHHGQTVVIGFSKTVPGQPDAIFLEENLDLQTVWER